MTNFEQSIIDLKEEYGLCAIKVDLASEIITQEELQKNYILAKNSGVDLTVKIGGCDALTDISYAYNYHAQNILVPMIETPYSLDKSVETICKIYDTLEDINIFINIESIVGVENIVSILKTEGAKYVKGIVLGRDDLTKSLNMDMGLINSDRILKIASDMANIVSGYGKEFVIGGKILPDTEEFILKLPLDKITRIETRKATFNVDIIKSNYRDGINKALQFEYMWLDNCESEFPLAKQRMQTLENVLA